MTTFRISERRACIARAVIELYGEVAPALRGAFRRDRCFSLL